MGFFKAINFASKALRSFDPELLAQYKEYNDDELLRVIKRRVGDIKKDIDVSKFVDFEDSRTAMHILNHERKYTAPVINEALKNGYFKRF